MTTLPHDVNTHCVDRIFDLATTKAVIASEDIYDANGNKLWAKGLEISPQLKERMAQRRLRSPLELSLEIEGSISTGIVVDDCLKAIDGDPLLPRLAGSKLARATLSRLRMVQLPGPIRLLLNVTHNSIEKSYRNALYTLAISAGFAARHDLPDRDLEMLLVTALLHDLGEIYISPEYVNTGRVLNAEDWAAIASHPMLGHAVARDIGKLPDAVTAGIAQHHERMDGSGYPAMLTKAEISPIGRIVAVADAAAAILLRGDEGGAYQTAMALKIVPEEFDCQCVSFIIEALRPLALEGTRSGKTCTSCKVRSTVDKVKAVESMIDGMASTDPSAPANDALSMAIDICRNVSKALRATGVEQLVREGNCCDGMSCKEACDIGHEIRWRLRNLSRNLQLRIKKRGTEADAAFLQPLFALLDKEVESVSV